MPSKKRQDRDGLHEHPRSPYWYGSFVNGSGKRVRRSTRCRSKQEAQRVLARWRLEEGQAPGPDQGNPLFEHLMASYYKEVSSRKKDPIRDQNCLQHLRPAFDGKPIREIGRAEVNAYLQRRREEGAAASTINSEIGLFRAACNYARKNWEWDIPNPAEGFQEKEPEGRVRYLTRREAARLLWQSRSRKAPHLQDFILLALHTGARKRELTKLTWSQVDLERGLIFLEAEKSKGIKRRSVPLNELACLALRRRARANEVRCPASPFVFARANGERMDDPKKAFATAKGKAEIEDFRIHDLRHTFASWLVMEGVSLYEVRDLLGHASIDMTQRYAHLAPENLRAAVNRLAG